MVNLKAIQDKLNSDDAYRAEFLRDPVELLQNEGLILAENHIGQLRELVKELNHPHESAIGSNLTPDASNAEVSIGIGKSWSF